MGRAREYGNTLNVLDLRLSSYMDRLAKKLENVVDSISRICNPLHKGEVSKNIQLR
jgi:hypothetical protein